MANDPASPDTTASDETETPVVIKYWDVYRVVAKGDLKFMGKMNNEGKQSYWQPGADDIGPEHGAGKYIILDCKIEDDSWSSKYLSGRRLTIESTTYWNEA